MKRKFEQLFKRSATGFGLGALFWFSFLYVPPWIFSCVLVAILVQIVLYEWTRLFDPRQLPFWLLLPFYPLLSFVLMIWMNHSCYRPLLMVLFVLVSAHDTGSYLIGTLFGKHKIASLISPGKTWEGFFGGYLFAIVGLWFLLWEFKDPKPLPFVLGFTLVVCLTSLAGDLFESLLKRHADVKDSGAILPGHGGFLDRFDGILVTVIFFYLFRDWLLGYFTHIVC
jgi:phosphatidate cytidylyltransferase